MPGAGEQSVETGKIPSRADQSSGTMKQFAEELCRADPWLINPWLFRAAVVLIALIYAASVSSDWYPTPDSALYLMLGDNLANGEGYTLWGKPHIHVPPGFPLLLAGLKLLGIDSYFALNLVMAALAGVALSYCYYALQQLVSLPLARLLVCLVALSHATHLASVCLLSDIPFMAIVWLGLWCQLRGLRTGSRTLELGSLLLLASCSLRVVGVLVAIGAAIGLILQPTQVSRKRIWANSLGTAICLLMVAVAGIVLVILAGKSNALPNYFTEFSRFFERLSVPVLIHPLVNVIETGPELSTLLTGQTNESVKFVLVLLWMPIVAGAVIAWKQGNRLSVCLLACYLLPLLVLRPLLARYLLPISPLIFWYFLEGFRCLWERLPHHRGRGLQVMAICTVVIISLHLPKASKLAYRVHNPETDNAFRGFQSLTDVAQFLRRTAKDDERFVTNDEERQLAYLSGLWSIPEAEHTLKYSHPDSAVLDSLLTPQVRFLVVHDSGYRSHYRKFCRTVSSYPGLERVHANEHFQVFRFDHSEKVRQVDKGRFSSANMGMVQSW